MTKRRDEARGPAKGKGAAKAPPPKAKAKSSTPRAGSGRALPRPASSGKGRTRPGAKPQVPPGVRAKPIGEKALPPAEVVSAPGPEASTLSEEDEIRSAKYLPRDLPRRLFEEERFLFPESYGVNRVRLLVKDPDWLFAYWDVDPASLTELSQELGERSRALSRLTLRVTDPVNGGTSDILLPPGARWWYVRGDSSPRSYQAELGVTLPSGEFRKLAESNTVVTPQSRPSAQSATTWTTYDQVQASPPGAGRAGGLPEGRMAALGPWPGPQPSRRGGEGASATAPRGAGEAYPPGGASDLFRR